MLLNESIATCLKVQTMTHFHFEIQFFTAATPEGKKTHEDIFGKFVSYAI